MREASARNRWQLSPKYAALIGGYKKRIWTGMAVGFLGLGLLMTQSRGALLGIGVAVVLMGAYGNRWVRYGLPVLMVIAGLLVYSLGVEELLDPAVGAGVERNLEKRQELWDRAVYISQDFAFTGIGLRSFPVVVDLLYPLFLIRPNARLPHPHNLYLDMVASLSVSPASWPSGPCWERGEGWCGRF